MCMGAIIILLANPNHEGSVCLLLYIKVVMQRSIQRGIWWAYSQDYLENCNANES